MLARMVWRDLRRRPVDVVSLIALIALSVLLATASAGLLATVAGSSDRLLDAADSPDLVQMHAGEIDEAAITAWAAEQSDIDVTQIVPLLTVDGDRMWIGDAQQTANVQQNSLMVPSPERDLVLTLDGTALTAVEPGTVWLPVYYEIETDARVGDVVTVTGADGFRREVTVAGFLRDPIMNTAIASSKRLAVAAADFDAIADHTGQREYLVEFWLSDSAAAGTVSAAYLQSGLPATGPTVDRSTFRLLTVIGEGLDAGVVILAAALLLVVGLLCLRLSLLTAMHRELREIGVMKAIGLPTRSIRRLYLAKYGAIGVIACLLGLVAGLAVLPVMTRSLTAYMGAGSGTAPLVSAVLTALVIALLILSFVWLLLLRIGRISAVRALRAGAGVARRGPRLSLHRARVTPVAIRQGVIGLLRRPASFALSAAVFAVATFIVVVPLSAARTIAAPEFVSYMGIPHTDLRVDLPADGSTDGITAALTGDPAIDTFVVHDALRAETPDTDGVPISVFVENGDHTTLPIAYAEGRAPSEPGEVALSLLTLARTGHHLGDSIDLTIGDTVRPTTIVGAYQDITNGGSTARTALSTTAEVVSRVITIDLADGVDPATEADRLAAELPDGRVSEVEAYRAQTLGPLAARIGSTSLVIAAVALALTGLITVMSTRMALAADRGQVAIARALGTPDRALRAQYATRVLAALAVGLPLGAFSAITLGQSVFNLLFEGLYGGFAMVGQGTSRIEFLSEPLLVGVLLPAALAAVVVLATLAACRDITSTSIRSVVPE